MLNWEILDSEQKLEIIQLNAEIKPQLIFKHSTRCSISSMAMSRLEREWPINEKTPEIHYLDLLKHQTISNLLAETYSVEHESPQALLIYKGKCIYSESHGGISVNDIMELLSLPQFSN